VRGDGENREWRFHHSPRQLYEDETGGSIFEYDRPSSFFGQYGDERVTEVGRNLDAALEAALRQAAE
jgi:hypothetical protein